MEIGTIHSEKDCFVIRKIKDEDAKHILDIFNYYVENSFAAYPDEKVPDAFFTTLKNMVCGEAFYVIEGLDGDIAGFGLLRKHHPAASFNRTAEVTYFVLPKNSRKGLGSKLLSTLAKEAKDMGIDTLLANISSCNEPSIMFHKKHGFRECGCFQRVGKKFGKDFDVIWMQKNI